MRQHLTASAISQPGSEAYVSQTREGRKKWPIKAIKFTPCGVCSKGCTRIQLEGIWGKAGAPTLPVQTDCSSLWIPTQMPLGDRRRQAGGLGPVQAHDGVTSASIRYRIRLKCLLCLSGYTVGFVLALVLNILKSCWLYFPLCPGLGCTLGSVSSPHKSLQLLRNAATVSWS